MTEKTFILCVGAQKAGTTWLYNYLKEALNVDTGFSKEYHIWDAINVKECENFRVSLIKVRSRGSLLRWAMQTFPYFYFDYLEKILRSDGINITADITPSYSSLSSDVFKKINEEFKRRGIDVKVVFLMRDPVERCWSAVRMNRRHGWANGGVRLDVSEEEALIQYFDTRHARIRGSYDKTIIELEQVFDESQVYFGFYETLIESEEIASISSFLGVESRPHWAKKIFIVNEKNVELSESILGTVAKGYEDVYEFCRKRFPVTSTIWQGLRFLK